MRILVVSGASGGHIFPAVAFLEKVKERDPAVDALLVLPRKHAGTGQDFPVPVRYLGIENIPLSPFSETLRRILRACRAAVESLLLVARFRPDVVVGFGSLASVPVVVWGWFLRCRVVLHEQNVVPGRATRFLSRLADCIAVSFPRTRELLGAARSRTAVTGNPVRSRMRVMDKAGARAFFGLPEREFTLLVMGGSQGSRTINAAAVKALAGLDRSFSFQVIHLTGAQDAGEVAQAYARAGIRCRVFPFLQEMEYAYSAGDLAITRAGATTVAELCRFRLPAVLVPYPFAYAHQHANARVLEDAGAAFLVDDDRIEDRLGAVLEQCMGDAQRLEGMRRAYRESDPGESAAALVDLVYAGA